MSVGELVVDLVVMIGRVSESNAVHVHMLVCPACIASRHGKYTCSLWPSKGGVGSREGGSVPDRRRAAEPLWDG